MVTKYDTSTDIAPNDVMAFSATEDPMLMHERRQLTTRDSRTAGNGMFQPGET